MYMYCHHDNTCTCFHGHTIVVQTYATNISKASSVIISFMCPIKWKQQHYNQYYARVLFYSLLIKKLYSSNGYYSEV